MREIKFRAWREDDRIMYDDVTFDKVEVSWFNPIAKQDPDDLEPGCWVIIGDREENSLLPHVILMQYTGLRDKNGKEIYEGDIVQTYFTEKIKGGKAVVKYIERSFCMSQNQDDTEMDCVWFNLCEVIGNIYENPELLVKV